MAENYTILAPVYETLGMADFGRQITPRLINYAQQNEWLGRRILDLGCGTGAVTGWLAENGLSAVGLDQSDEMLQIAGVSFDPSRGLSLDWKQADIRQLDDSFGPVDMAIAIDVVNELDTIRELEALFKGVMTVLKPGKLFVFDLHTVGGLAERGDAGDRFLFDSSELSVFARQAFDHERQTCDILFTAFRLQGSDWARTDTSRILKAYPLQAIATLLQRNGFKNVQVLDTRMNPFDPRSTRLARVIFVATK